MSSQLHEHNWAKAKWTNTGNGNNLFCVCVITLYIHRAQCTGDVQPTQLCFLTHFSSPRPHPFLSIHLHSNFSHLFSPEIYIYIYSFWSQSTQISLKSEKQECSALFEPEDTCSSVSGEQFRAKSKKMKMSRTRYYLETNQALSWANNRNTICFAFFHLKAETFTVRYIILG